MTLGIISWIREEDFKRVKEKGLSFVEVVGTCNSGWKMSPVDANKWMHEHMFAKYPLGDIKDI